MLGSITWSSACVWSSSLKYLFYKLLKAVNKKYFTHSPVDDMFTDNRRVQSGIGCTWWGRRSHEVVTGPFQATLPQIHHEEITYWHDSLIPFLLYISLIWVSLKLSLSKRGEGGVYFGLSKNDFGIFPLYIPPPPRQWVSVGSVLWVHF